VTEEPEEEVVHYNISVTARQAATFFVVLLLSLSLAFFFGMKTGAAARRASPLEPSQTISELSGEDRRPVISEGEKRPEAVEKKASTKPSPQPGVSRPSEPSFGFSEEADRKTLVASKKTEPPQEKATRAPEPTSTKPAAAAVGTVQPVPTAKPVSKEQLYVQVLATNDAAKADLLRKELKTAGFKSADVSPVPGKAGLFRLRLGPYNDRAMADKVIGRLKKPFPNVKPSVVKP
jgi:cell division protein FtsN